MSESTASLARPIPIDIDPRIDPDHSAAVNLHWWPFARHVHECVTGRRTSHLWACRGWRCWGYPFRACRRHRRVGRTI
jgi:hypothetical protein